MEAGTKLGTYEILAPLGAGGMGEVYQARDGTLERTVAIKVLPDALAKDGERIARFEREARLLASLNHPNIAVIHGFEESGGTRFLVLEHVDGETLADRLKRGPLPVPDALNITRQIADALESAHGRGVIHRDLKPGNVMIRPDGAVKVLDFGLARAMGEESHATSSVTSSPTITANYTKAGTILGTAAYMSPEQARGRQLDKRTDVWSFGCVLYECLGGRRPFGGDTATDMIAQILEREPDWSALPSNTPRDVYKLLRRCLQKDRNGRLRDLGDALIELNEAIEKQSWLAVLEPPSQAQAGAGWGKMIFFATAALASGLALGFVISQLGRATSGGQVIRASVQAPPNARFITLGDFEGHAVVSPDGRMLAFSARDSQGVSRLWVRPLDGLSARPLTGTEGARNAFWSPDARSLGFFADRQLKRVDVAGGPPIALCDAPNGRGGTWNQHGVILFTPDFRTPVYRVPASGGSPAAVTTLDESKHTTNRWPHFLPDGDHFLYIGASHDPSRAPANALYFASLDGTEQHVVMRTNARALFASGYLLFMREATLVAQEFDDKTGTLRGQPVTVADTVLSDRGSWFAAYSASQTGILTYNSGILRGSTLAWIDRATQEVTPIGRERDLYFAPRLSPDGKRLAVARGNPGDVWIYELDRGLGTRFTLGPSYLWTPVWSPDGAQLAYSSSFRADGRNGIYMKPADGTAGEDVLIEDDNLIYPLDRSPDGRFMLFWKGIGRPVGAYWLLPLDAGREPMVFLESPFASGGARFSPDGRWVAYTSNVSGTDEVYVAPFHPPDEDEARSGAGIGGQRRISANGGAQPVWSRDGKELFYMAPDNKLFAVEVSSTDGALEVGAARSLFTLDIRSGVLSAEYDVSPDGRRFVINSTEGDSPPITLVINWPAELAAQ